MSQMQDIILGLSLTRSDVFVMWQQPFVYVMFDLIAKVKEKVGRSNRNNRHLTLMLTVKSEHFFTVEDSR